MLRSQLLVERNRANRAKAQLQVERENAQAALVSALDGSLEAFSGCFWQADAQRHERALFHEQSVRADIEDEVIQRTACSRTDFG